MDQSIAGAATKTPRRFLRDWALTVLWPALGCGGIAAALIRDDLQLEDAAFVIFLLGYAGALLVRSSGCCKDDCSARWSSGLGPGRWPPGAAAAWR